MSAAEVLYERARTRVGKVPLGVKVFQAVGALPEALKNFAFTTFLLFYYNQVLGLDAFKTSTVLAVALTLDAVVDPLIGSFSDHLKTRLGRRHLLMYLSVVPIAAGLYLVFSPPHGLTGDGLLAWLFATVILSHIGMSLFVVPWTALYAEFSDDYAERTAIVTWRYGVGWLGSLVFITCTWRFVFASTPAFSPGQLNPHAYGAFAPALALSVAAAVFVTTHLTRREIPYLLQPVGATPGFSLGRVWRDVASTFVNVNFLILFVGALLTAAVTGATDALGIYLSTYFWGLAPEQLQWFSLAVLGAVIAFFTIGPIERVMDKKTVLIGSFILIFVDGMGVIGLRLLNLLPPNGAPILIFILVGNTIVATYFGTVLGIMFVSMIADTLDVQELATGKRQEGVFAAALSFSGKATAGLGAMMAGLLLQHVVMWPAKAHPGAVDPHIVTRLGLVAGVLVPTLLIIPLILGSRYNITRESHAVTREALARRRAG